jgi:hypothetical protein
MARYQAAAEIRANKDEEKDCDCVPAPQPTMRSGRISSVLVVHATRALRDRMPTTPARQQRRRLDEAPAASIR